MLDNEEPHANDLVDLDGSNFHDIGTLKEDALEYISGYIIRKLNLKGFECQENSFTWVDQVSKGYLKKPSRSFLEKIKCLETVLIRLMDLRFATTETYTVG